jgi:hypothetical protein
VVFDRVVDGGLDLLLGDRNLAFRETRCRTVQVVHPVTGEEEHVWWDDRHFGAAFLDGLEGCRGGVGEDAQAAEELELIANGADLELADIGGFLFVAAGHDGRLHPAAEGQIGQAALRPLPRIVIGAGQLGLDGDADGAGQFGHQVGEALQLLRRLVVKRFPKVRLLLRQLHDQQRAG